MLVPNFRFDGTVMDLASPQAEDIDFGEMANTLSKIARFNGRHAGIAYSVAQHSVMGADALYNETGDGLIAGYFLLHDGHEYLVGDVSRPMVLLTQLMMGFCLADRGILPSGEAGGGIVRDAIERGKLMLDGVIYRAANLLPPEQAPYYLRHVKAMDERMLVAECRALYGTRAEVPLAENNHQPPRLTGAIRPWGAAKAEEAFVDRLEKYLGIVVERGR